MREPALKSHFLSKKHIERSPSTNTTSSANIQSFLPEVSRESNEKAFEDQKEEPETEKNKQTTINQSFSTSARIAAVLNLECVKDSMNSSSNSGALFTAMFPDSEIAKRFQCGRTKAGCVAHFGLAPYFSDIFYSQISNCPYYAISFVESLNNVVQKGQMDLNIRYWDNDADQVATCYLGSEFLGRSTAQDVLETFLNGVDKLDQLKILKVTSDGPNVKPLFLNSMTEFREEKEYLSLVDIGTCGLHVIHVSLKTGTQKGTDWDIQKLLKSMWQFLREAPVRRALYENISESLDYPVKFCGHKWAEYEDCAARAESLLDGYRTFITHICSLKMSNLMAKTKVLRD